MHPPLIQWQCYKVSAFIAIMFLSFPVSVLSQCLFNDTHCSCTPANSPGVCPRYSVGTPDDAICSIGKCETSSVVCDCMGPLLCERRPCNSWQTIDMSQPLAVGTLARCKLVPFSSSNASICVERSTSTESISATSGQGSPPEINPSPSAILDAGINPSMSAAASLISSPSQTPTTSSSISPTQSDLATPSSGLSPTPSSSSSQSISSTPSSIPSPIPSPIVPICPGGLNMLNFVPLLHPLTSDSNVEENVEYVTAFSDTDYFSARYTTVQGCATTQLSAVDDKVIEILLSVTSEIDIPPSEGWGRGYCKLTGPIGDQEFDSFGALIVESSGFAFQPGSLSTFDIDNQVLHTVGNVPTAENCVEAIAVFGALNGNIVLPVVSAGSNHIVQTYKVSTDSMNAMGLLLGSTSVPGGQMPEGQSNTCSTEPDARGPCQLQFNFSDPVDTLVVMFGYGVYDLPGRCSGTLFVESAPLKC